MPTSPQPQVPITHANPLWGIGTYQPLFPVATSPTGWTSQDINTGSQPSSMTFSSTNNAWTIVAGGSDIGGTADSFHFSWVPLSGDGTLTARVIFLTNTDAHAKAGVMLRQNITAVDSPFWMIAVTPTSGLLVQERDTAAGTGGPATTLATRTGAPVIFLRVARAAQTFSAFTSSDGQNWTLVATLAMTNMGGTIEAGLAVSSHNTSVVTTAVFDNVSVAPTTIYAEGFPSSAFQVAHPYAGAYGGGQYGYVLNTKIRAPQQVQPLPAPIIGMDGTGTPIVRGYPQLVWSYTTMRPDYWYYLLNIYNQSARQPPGFQYLVLLQYPDTSSLTTPVRVLARMDPPTHSNRTVGAYNGVTLHFTYVGQSQLLPTVQIVTI